MCVETKAIFPKKYLLNFGMTIIFGDFARSTNSNCDLNSNEKKMNFYCFLGSCLFPATNVGHDFLVMSIKVENVTMFWKYWSNYKLVKSIPSPLQSVLWWFTDWIKAIQQHIILHDILLSFHLVLEIILFFYFHNALKTVIIIEKTNLCKLNIFVTFNRKNRNLLLLSIRAFSFHKWSEGIEVRMLIYFT